MNLIKNIQSSFTLGIKTLFNLDDAAALKISELNLNVDESKQEFGDLNANAAMILAKELKKNPREVAQIISSNFKHPAISRIEIAGPGFLNLFLTPESLPLTCATTYQI